ncbi:hypothetical protein [Pseudidiomarina mangrovi]|uniref:alpha-2-macroglobulin family protein n=1 Tax=Pseudidiomarina mangrovi TaxID=2487133 RepID=UPI000FC99D6D|nr:hypothetical protein [Pseudidiomarina mangrovi]
MARSWLLFMASLLAIGLISLVPIGEARIVPERWSQPLSAAELSASQLAPPTIQFDDPSMAETRQILLRFAEPISIAGELPNPEQIAAITIEGEYFPGCRWRFVGTTALACDLTSALPRNSEFVLTVSGDFSAAGKRLAEPAQFTLTTAMLDKTSSLPSQINLKVDFTANSAELEVTIYAYGRTIFPEGGDSSEQADPVEDAWLSALTDHLTLINPDRGVEQLKMSREDDEYTISLNVTKKLTQFGKFQVVLPAGLWLPGSNLPLGKDLVLGEIQREEHFGYMGYRCHDDFDSYFEQPTELQSSLLIDCPTSNVELLFSHNFPIPEYQARRERDGYGHQLQWLDWLGGNAGLSRLMMADNSFYQVSLYLQPEQQYQLDLAGLWQAHAMQEAGIKAPLTAVVPLATAAVFNDWWPVFEAPEIHNDYDVVKKVAQLRSGDALQIGVRSLESLTLQYDVMTSAQQLLDRLNGKRSSTLLQMTFADQQEGNLYPLPITDQLPTGGVVWIDGPQQVRGTGVPNTPYRLQDLVQFDDFLLQYRGFQNGMIATWDWSGLPLRGVAVYKVCQGDASPIYLGESDSTGSLATQLVAPTESKDEPDTCWLWGSLGDRHASAALEDIEAVQTAVVGHLSVAQSQLRRDDLLHVTVDILHRHHQALNPSLLKLELLHQKSRYELPLSELSEHGLASATFRFQEAMPLGYYHLELSYDGQLIDSVYQINLTEFIPPQMELTTTLTVDPNDLSMVTVSGSIKTVAKAGLANQQVEMSLQFYENLYIEAAANWPKNWDYGFWLEFFEQSKAIKLTETHSTDAAGVFIGDFKNPFPNRHVRATQNVQASLPNGEVVQSTNRLSIYGLPYYVGWRYSSDDSIEVRLLNRDGEWLDSFPSDGHRVELWTRDDEPSELLNSCVVDGARAHCRLPPKAQSQLRIVTADYMFTDTISQRNRVEGKELVLKAPTSMMWGSEQQITVHSDIAQTAVLWIFSDQLIEARRLELVAGAQYLHVSPQQSWGTAVTFGLSYWQDNTLAYAEQQVLLVTNSAPLQVSVAVQQAQLTQQGQQTITVTSNHDSTVQLWLIDESALVGEFASIPVAKYFGTLDAYHWQRDLSFSQSSSLDYPKQSIANGFYGWFGGTNYKQSYSRRHRVPPPMSPSADMALHDSLSNSEDPRLILWQPQLELKANQPEVIEVALPPRATRWTVVAVAASGIQRTVVEQVFDRVMAVEFSAYAAPISYVGDHLQLAVTATNRDAQPQQQAVTVSLNDQPLGVVKFTLAGNQTQRQSLSLPALPQGAHRVLLTSADRQQTRQLDLQVLSNLQEQQQTVWNQHLGPQSWQLPTAAQGVRFAYTSTASLDLQQLQQRRPLISWPQQLNEAFRLANLADSQRTGGHSTQLAARLTSYHFNTYDKRFNRYDYFSRPNDDWLTAYSLLVLHRISQLPVGQLAGEIVQQVDAEQVLETIITESTDSNAQVLALWALVELQQLSWQQFTDYAEQVRSTGDITTLLLYVASMQGYPESEALRQQLLSQLSTQGYQTATGVLLNDALQHCLVLYTQPTDSAIYNASYQQLGISLPTTGDIEFGLCQMILATVKPPHQLSGRVSVSALGASESGRWQVQVDQPQRFISARYNLPITSLQSVQQGLALSRTYRIYRQGTWHDLQPSDQVMVGDLIEVQLTINSPTEIDQVSVTDVLPGSWYTNLKRSRSCWFYCYVHTKGNAVYYYYTDLPAGESVIRYQVEVRAGGSYLAPPAQLQVDGVDELKARTEAVRWTIN